MVGNYIDKFFSRKFFAFLIATLLLIFKVIDAQTWLIIVCAYIGVQGLVDIIKAFTENSN